jgi:plastocyanin
MTDWDLLTPGIGLTSIGIVGVGISLAGIAKTFIDGMHAVSLLTMFIGMIFLASGLFKDGFPSTGRAKSATFITLGFLVTFGVAAAVTVSVQVPSIFAYIGLMAMIGIPGAVLAVTSFRKPQYVKAMGVIFIAGAAVGGITFYAFGLVTPKPPQPAEEEQQQPAAPAAPATPPANVIKASIPAGASAQGNPSYDPNPLTVAKGDGVEWTNNDNVPHTVTSKADSGKTFDSKVMAAGKTFLLNTATLKEGDYEYYCQLHPFMDGMLKVGGAGASSAAGGNATSSSGNATGGNATTQSSGGNATTGSSAATANNNTNATAPSGNATSAPSTASGGAKTAATVTSVSIVLGASTPTNGQFFSPAEAKSAVGSMVTWTNHDTTLHTVTSGKVVNNTPAPDKVFDSGLMKAGASYSYVFEKAGEYDYYCMLHPYMTGKVTVS